jgi:hypothetical protein
VRDMIEPQTPPTAATKRPRRITVLVAAAAAVGVLLSTGAFLVFGGPYAAAPFTVSGSVTVNKVYGDYCPTLIDEKVHVLNEAGVIVAVGRAERGIHDSTSPTCSHSFTVTEVPAGYSAYGVVLLGMKEPPLLYTETVLRNQTPLWLIGSYRLTA